MKGSKGSRGFTLVELMAALVVISIGLVSVHQGFVRCLDASLRTEKKLTASFFAERVATDAFLEPPTR